MSVKSDRWIIEQSEQGNLIDPFARDQVKKVEQAPGQFKNVLSYGVSSYGYDMRIGHDFKVLKSEQKGIIDPKNFDQSLFEAVHAEESLLIPPHGLVLGQTIEYFKIPRDILTICFGKSTYARCGVFMNITPFEPEWEGHATIGINNLSPVPVRLYAGEGIAQLLFLEAAEVCAVSYQDRKGKYQAQKSITTAKV